MATTIDEQQNICLERPAPIMIRKHRPPYTPDKKKIIGTRSEIPPTSNLSMPSPSPPSRKQNRTRTLRNPLKKRIMLTVAAVLLTGLPGDVTAFQQPVSRPASRSLDINGANLCGRPGVSSRSSPSTRLCLLKNGGHLGGVDGNLYPRREGRDGGTELYFWRDLLRKNKEEEEEKKERGVDTDLNMSGGDGDLNNELSVVDDKNSDLPVVDNDLKSDLPGGDNDDDDHDDNDDDDLVKDGKKRNFRIPFFAQRGESKEEEIAEEEEITEEEEIVEKEPIAKKEAPNSDDPVAYAKFLRNQAMKIKLEAERMEVQLTLDKITKLENKLSKQPKEAEKESIQNDIDALLQKLKDPNYVAPVKVAPILNAASSNRGSSVSTPSPVQLEERIKNFESTPQFLRIIAAKAAGFEDDSNVTAVVLKMFEDEQTYTALQQRTAAAGPSRSDNSDGSQEDKFRVFDMSQASSSSTDEEKDKEEIKDQLIQSLYPKSTRKEDQAPSQATLDFFRKDILELKCNDSFQVTGTPTQVPGGFILRGSIRNDKKSSEVMNAIYKELFDSRTGLKEQISCFMVSDPLPFEEAEEIADRPPVLFITGPNVATDRNIGLNYLTSLVGLVSISFLSFYPFILNQAVSDRVDESINLAQSSGNADLGWLTDMTSPIFFSFLFLQLSHELAHFVVAKNKGIDISIPTLVPSPIMGLTSSITTLKSSPKTRQDLFDFAIAGPAVGMLASTALLVTGLMITRQLDNAAFQALPQLPYSFLLQSSLGGGIVEGILGPGTLDVADPTVSTIHLHPFTIAGFTSLVVNAMNLLPFGRTDGGRVSLALFGRGGAQIASLLTIFGTFIGGLFFSDALLLFGSFLVFFMNEPEIPCVDEIEEVDFSRVLIATAMGVAVLLTVIPLK